MKLVVVTEETIYSGIFEVIFSDLLDNGGKILTRYLNEGNIIRKGLFHLLYKNKVNDHLKGRFEKILKPRYSLIETLDSFEGESTIVLFVNASLQKFYNCDNLLRIKSKYKSASFVLLFVDAVFQPQAQRAFMLSKQKNLFDLIYTFDVNDAEKYGFNFCTMPYSKLNVVSKKGEGIYFCGSEKGRADFLNKVYLRLQEIGIPVDFEVFGNKESSKYAFQIKTNGLKPYREIVAKLQEFNCVLDVVQGGREEQTGLSLRVYEALVYDKVLITNNRNIFGFPLYNPQFMHYIESPSEIQAKWLKVQAEYNYSGQLSPMNLFHELEERLKKD